MTQGDLSHPVLDAGLDRTSLRMSNRASFAVRDRYDDRVSIDSVGQECIVDPSQYRQYNNTKKKWKVMSGIRIGKRFTRLGVPRPDSLI